MERDELTYKIIGCAMRVHSELGNGFQEVIYQRCLAIGFFNEGLEYEREKEQNIFYRGMNVGTLCFAIMSSLIPVIWSRSNTRCSAK